MRQCGPISSLPFLIRIIRPSLPVFRNSGLARRRRPGTAAITQTGHCSAPARRTLQVSDDLDSPTLPGLLAPSSFALRAGCPGSIRLALLVQPVPLVAVGMVDLLSFLPSRLLPVTARRAIATDGKAAPCALQHTPASLQVL